MNPNRLRELFTRVLGASLAAPLVLTGCGGLDLDGYSPPACMNDSLAVRDLSPVAPADFVELRSVSRQSDSESFFMEAALSSSGTACATATEQTNCRFGLETLTPTTGFNTSCGASGCVTYYLATTQGDVVTAYNSVESLLGFLGTIDTPQEAALRVFADGDRSYHVNCVELEQGAVKANADGSFNVVATTGSGCAGEPSLWQHVLRVSPQGEVRETRSELLARSSPGNCGD
ncbi:hypothetical protein [Myxococcus qinghaiensis]|uniref:hypothetical protein n=1 Tax=Myxococcus qinghaiensis TaxID=2906758 RepID=UPI0020A8372C|nr:hypothetical protein [Myxococcus qinghaiensis]MCP3165506.1 hypothetical protein [Myxococcus qinghaiensis]